MSGTAYLDWGIKEQVDKEKMMEKSCECCEIYKSTTLYCIKENRCIALFHICDNCVYSNMEDNYDNYDSSEREYCLVFKNI